MDADDLRKERILFRGENELPPPDEFPATISAGAVGGRRSGASATPGHLSKLYGEICPDCKMRKWRDRVKDAWACACWAKSQTERME